MPIKKQKTLDNAQLRRRALSRWENEGGAPMFGHQESLTAAALEGSEAVIKNDTAPIASNNNQVRKPNNDK